MSQPYHPEPIEDAVTSDLSAVISMLLLHLLTWKGNISSCGPLLCASFFCYLYFLCRARGLFPPLGISPNGPTKWMPLTTWKCDISRFPRVLSSSAWLMNELWPMECGQNDNAHMTPSPGLRKTLCAHSASFLSLPAEFKNWVFCSEVAIGWGSPKWKRIGSLNDHMERVLWSIAYIAI